MQRRRTAYVRAQTLTLMAVQALPLFLLPYVLLPYAGHNGAFDGGTLGWLADHLFPLSDQGHGREYWRAFGLVLARGLNEDSEIVVWSRAVATAILAGVIAKLILFSTGALATIPLPVRVAAAVCGFLAYLVMRRSVFAGVAVGEAVLLLGGFLFAH